MAIERKVENGLVKFKIYGVLFEKWKLIQGSIGFGTLLVLSIIGWLEGQHIILAAVAGVYGIGSFLYCIFYYKKVKPLTHLILVGILKMISLPTSTVN